MKNLTPLFTVTLFALLILFSACTKENITLPNETPVDSREAMIGFYTQEFFCEGDNEEDVTNIFKGAKLDEIIFENFVDFKGLVATVDENEITIPLQGDPSDFQIKGNGTFSTNSMTIELVIIDDGEELNDCFVVLTKSTETNNTNTNSNDNTNNGSSTDIEAFDFFEEDMIGKWIRYHDFDGSYRYYIFSDDRTGCYWEQIGSSRKNKKYFSHWELADHEDNTFSIIVKTSSTSDPYSLGIFDYPENIIFKGGYDNLGYVPSNTIKECE